jgi:hypothetical protein
MGDGVTRHRHPELIRFLQLISGKTPIRSGPDSLQVIPTSGGPWVNIVERRLPGDLPTSASAGAASTTQESIATSKKVVETIHWWTADAAPLAPP